MSTYMILRKYQNKESETIDTGLTLEAAQEHCENPETSWKTATSREAIKRTDLYGPWFDCYTEE